jgi:PadR family transcriptional regulator, regulatory protein AphA
MTGLTNTSYALLGLLATHEMSGYDIKAFADDTVRHFWAISYGQIYPELRQLEELGLVESEEAAVGGRRRTVYRPTQRGREELEGWLGEPVEASMEIRDELLLRFFFSDHGAPEDRERLLQAMLKRHQDMSRKLADHRPVAARHGETAKLEVLDFGVAFHRFCADWFRQRLHKEG